MVRTFLFVAALIVPGVANAFCGFYVAKADAKLFNKASKVIIARGDSRTVITMANDYQGDMKEFAMVIPVPTVLKEKQVNVTENRIIDHLDAYTAPRLVEYFDNDPCKPVAVEFSTRVGTALEFDKKAIKRSADSLGVTIEAQYSVGEYDIVILSAKQSNGLFVYLNQEGYKVPDGATNVLGSYIKQGMKFFLAKVNLEKQEKSGFTYLRPLQVAFESDKFMLPIRLGTLNANGPQDLLLYTLTKKGRVETSNYRTVKIPSNNNIPAFVKNEFGDFYKDMFSTAVKKEGMRAVFLEYAWDMNWCDPCAADPLPNNDLRTLGVWWINSENGISPRRGGGAVNTFVTRLHVRYTADTFPEDLMLHETNDRNNFQGRYVMQHAFKGEMNCEAAKTYLKSLPKRFEKEAQTLSNLTGWDIADIRSKMEKSGQSFSGGSIGNGSNSDSWWEDIWRK